MPSIISGLSTVCNFKIKKNLPERNRFDFYFADLFFSSFPRSCVGTHTRAETSMGRSRYKMVDPKLPHLVTCTVLHWIPVLNGFSMSR